ncbi:MAG: hypothetical protein ACAI43_15310 [Phycisphaerae bacterium]|nr:hypothetical protein [Tepidisphaeraceae bacterium]
MSLAFAGLLGMLFFWLTDPVWGVGGLRAGGGERPATTQPVAAGEERLVMNPIDSRNEAIVGTTIGIGGSAVILLFGLVIAMRRPT